MGTTNVANSLNSSNVKLVKVLNNPRVAHIVASTYWTPMPRSIDWPTPSFNTLAFNMSDELMTTTAQAKTHCCCLSMSTNNCSKMSSSFQEELEPSPIELESWLEDEAMSSKWEYSSQVKWKEQECGRCFHLYNTHL